MGPDTGTSSPGNLLIVEDTSYTTAYYNNFYPTAIRKEDDYPFDKKELEKIENIIHERSMHEDKIQILQTNELHHAKQSKIKHKKHHKNLKQIRKR